MKRLSHGLFVQKLCASLRPRSRSTVRYVFGYGHVGSDNSTNSSAVDNSFCFRQNKDEIDTPFPQDSTKNSVKMMNWLGYGSEEQPLSSEEAANAKNIVSGAEGDDDFKDALEDEELDASKTFEVTKEELGIIRSELATEFPNDCNYMSDAYILSVASKPYSKDPTIRRPLEVSRRPSLKVLRTKHRGILMQIYLFYSNIFSIRWKS
jgi:hypothetical protein